MALLMIPPTLLNPDARALGPGDAKGRSVVSYSVTIASGSGHLPRRRGQDSLFLTREFFLLFMDFMPMAWCNVCIVFECVSHPPTARE